MENINILLRDYLNPIIMTLCLLLFVSFIWNIVLSFQLTMLNKRYKKFMRGTSGKNIEGMILEELENLKANDVKFNAINKRMDVMQDQLDRCLQKHSIVRYNAFNDTGSDLSYSIAFMDNLDNGIAITGIYGRNEFIGYAKPVENGNSSYPLSVEEQMAISRCQKTRAANKG
ncbi:MAG TPA: DUF4446 family protein [Patescibacteria group bacterium]|nr:DUF4446 family protein [Patescibacteria group bacterium]